MVKLFFYLAIFTIKSPYKPRIIKKNVNLMHLKLFFLLFMSISMIKVNKIKFNVL